MKHKEPPPISPPRELDWISSALAIVTVATVIAGVTVGSYVVIIEGQGNFASLADREYWALAIFFTGIPPLFTYLGVVVFAMATLFDPDDYIRHRNVKRAAVFFYFQTFCVIVFAILLMAAVFTEGTNRPQAFDKSNPALRPMDVDKPETDILFTDDCEKRRSHYDERQHPRVPN